MTKYLISLLLILVLISACKPEINKNTNETSEEEAVKTLVKEENLVKKVKTEEEIKEEHESCEEKVKDLQEDIYAKEFQVLKVEGDRQKRSMELQYYKDKDEDKFKQLESEFNDLGDEKNTLKEEVDTMKSAFKILAEKCELPIKLKKY